MANVNERKSAQCTSSICWACHAQQLEAVGEKNFLKMKRYGEDEGYWRIKVKVKRCCDPGQLNPLRTYVRNRLTFDWWLRQPWWYRAAFPWTWGHAPLPAYNEEIRTICLTFKQEMDGKSATTVGAVADAPNRAHNGNVQLCNMRINAVKLNDTDQLYKSSIFEIWPWLVNILANDNDREVPRCCFGCWRPGGTGGRIISREWVHVKAPVIQDSDDDECDDRRPTGGWKALEDELGCSSTVTIGESCSCTVKITADDAIFACSKIFNVKLLCDEEEGKFSYPLAARFGPVTCEGVFYASTPNRVFDAIQQRITEKHVPWTMSKHEEEELSGITAQILKEMGQSTDNTSLKARNRVIPRMAQFLLFGNIHPKSWTLARAENALSVLMSTYCPDYQFKASVKLERMDPKKPPRMIIADGDQGAIMSALVIGVLERFIFKYYRHKSIKGGPKSEMMKKICNDDLMLGVKDHRKSVILENDGNAYDTCCGVELRGLTENPLIDEVFAQISHLMTPVTHYVEQRKKADRPSKKKGKAHAEIKISIATNKVVVEPILKGDTWKVIEDEVASKAILKKSVTEHILSIRRSGDKGTSILNWIINIVCWAWVLFGPNGASFTSCNGKRAVDIFGTSRLYKAWFEGDDSLLKLSGADFTDVQLKELGLRWTKLGHRPKLFQRVPGDAAEFCGWKMVVTPEGLDYALASPDIPRLFKNVFYSHAKEAVQAAVEGDKEQFAKVVGPALIARAMSIADKFPSVANFLINYAESQIGANMALCTTYTRDDLFRMNVDLDDLLPEWWKDDDPTKLMPTTFGTYVSQARNAVSASIASGGIGDEACLAMQFKFAPTVMTWNDFCLSLNSVTSSTSDDDWRRILLPQLH